MNDLCAVKCCLKGLARVSMHADEHNECLAFLATRAETRLQHSVYSPFSSITSSKQSFQFYYFYNILEVSFRVFSTCSARGTHRWTHLDIQPHATSALTQKVADWVSEM